MTASIGLGANVGTAWVALRFSARGAAAQIRTELAGEGELAGATMGGSASKKFSSTFGKGLSGLGGIAKKAILPVAIAITAIGVESVKSASSFQASMIKVQTQAGASRKEVNKMSQAVLDLSKSSQQGPQELAAALYHLESLGLRGSKAMDALKISMKLAAVSGADLEQASSAIGGAWRTGIVGAKSFSQAAGTLNAIVGAGNMRMEDLLGALGTGILPSAKTFGLSLKQVGAALALFTDEGVPAVDAATRLRMTFSLLGAPSKLAEKQLNSIGITGIQLANTMRGPTGLIGAIQLLKTHLDASGLSLSAQAALLSRAFGGGRSSSAILSLLNNLKVLKQKQDQVNTSTGKFGAAVKVQSKTAAAQWAILKSLLDGLSIKIGNVLLPFCTQLVKFITGDMIPAVAKVAGAFGKIIPVDKIKSAWSELLLFLGVHQPKITPVIHMPARVPGLGRSSAVPVPAVPVTRGVPSYLTPNAVATQHAPIAAGAAQRISLVKTASNTVAGIDWSSVISKAISAAAKDAGKIGAAIVMLLAKVDWNSLGKKTVMDAVPFVIGFVNNLISAFISEAYHHPVDMVVFITSLIPIGKIAGIAGKLLGDIPLLGPMVKLFTKPLEAAGGIVERSLGKVLKFIFGPLLRRISPFFDGAKSWLVSKGQDILLGLAGGAGKGWRAVARWFGGIAGYVGRFFVGVGKWLFDAGSNLISGLLRGIASKMGGIGSWIKSSVVDPVINAVKGWFGIHSPSTVMHDIGFNLIAGLVRGIVTHDPVPMIKNVFGSLPAALGHLVEKGVVSIGSLPGKALKALGSLGGKIGGFFEHLFGGGGGSGVQQWAATVQQALSMLGLPKSLVGRVLLQMGTESGGNPNAINLWDSNAAAGDPSRGLMQVIGSTFSAYHVPGTSRNIYNPLANIAAAINYARHRYGPTLMSGGMGIGSGHGYDSGGIARGLGVMPKYTIKPERVLSPQQTSAFERLVDVLDGRSGGAAKPTRQKVEFDPRTMEMWIRDLSSQEAGSEIAFRRR